MFKRVFKNIDDILHKNAWFTGEFVYNEQTSRILFLNHLDALEREKTIETELRGKVYSHILEKPNRWENWTAPKGADDKFKPKFALKGAGLLAFVNQKLFSYLQGFNARANDLNSIEYKIGEIFREIKNKISNGYSLREIIDHIDELRFRSQD